MTTDDLRRRARETAVRRVEELGFPTDTALARDVAEAVQAGFESGYLAHAAQQPNQEQIARALDYAGAFCGDCGNEPGDFYDQCHACRATLDRYADAVLQLLKSVTTDDRAICLGVRTSLAADLDRMATAKQHTEEYAAGLRHAADLVRPAGESVPE